MNRLQPSIVIMKYQTPDGLTDFKCLEDESLSDKQKLDEMFENKSVYEADGCKVLWIRTIPSTYIAENFQLA